MPRPTTKEELNQLSRSNFSKLFELINSLTADQQTTLFDFEDRDKNIRDVLVHLYEWHQLFIIWVNSNISGKEASFLPEPYNWKTYPDMNVKLWEKHQETSYSHSISMIESSHAEIMQQIATFSDEELFTKKHFSWTGTTSLGSYAISATSSHYDWAMKKIKKHKKSLG